MFLAKLRRVTNLLLVVALAAGLVSHGVQAADMAAKMSMAAASAMPMSGKCDGCSGDGKGCMSSGTCSLICATVFALPVAGAVIELFPLVSEESAAISARAGWNSPPDPYPPRPTNLS
jgi:hypothetical protein